MSVKKFMYHFKEKLKNKFHRNNDVNDDISKYSKINIFMFLVIIFLCSCNIYNVITIVRTNNEINKYKIKLSKYEIEIKQYKIDKDKLEKSKKDKNDLKSNKSTELELKKKNITDLESSIDSLKKEVN